MSEHKFSRLNSKSENPLPLPHTEIRWLNPAEFKKQQAEFVKTVAPMIEVELAQKFQFEPKLLHQASFSLARAIFAGRNMYAQAVMPVHQVDFRIGYESQVKNSRVGGMCESIFDRNGQILRVPDLRPNQLDNLKLKQETALVSGFSVIYDLKILDNILNMSLGLPAAQGYEDLVQEEHLKALEKKAVEVERCMVEEVAHGLFWLDVINDPHYLHAVVAELQAYPMPDFMKNGWEFNDKDRETYHAMALERHARVLVREFLQRYYPQHISLADI